MGIHGGDGVSFFRKGFAGNPFLLWAVLSTFVLQLIVLYVPFMQFSFETMPITLTQLLICSALGAVVLFAVELEKLLKKREILQ
jgi:Ca2+-transporting ATPase